MKEKREREKSGEREKKKVKEKKKVERYDSNQTKANHFIFHSFNVPFYPL